MNQQPTPHTYHVYTSGFTYSVALNIPGAPRVMTVSSQGTELEQAAARSQCQAFADELNARHLDLIPESMDDGADPEERG